MKKYCLLLLLIFIGTILSAQPKKTNVLVEYVAVYPILCDLAGLSKPFHLQGESLVPLFENPELSW